jgi:hypothetical protein
MLFTLLLAYLDLTVAPPIVVMVFWNLVCMLKRSRKRAHGQCYLLRTESIIFGFFLNWGVRAVRLTHARACISRFYNFIIYLIIIYV